MIDRYGRKIEYLRISVTQNCNLKCIYCNPDGDHCKENQEQNLSPKEIEKITRAMAKAGIKKVRLTGGEPLVRHDIYEIISRISRIKGIEDIAMTTNGINLLKMARDLKTAGLQRINISLDSLNKDKFKQITGGGELEKTLEGIDLALELGMTPVKINTVLIKGVNDNEIDEIIELARNRPIEVRFIELMPMGCFGENNADKIIRNDEVIKVRPALKYLEKNDKSVPAVYYGMEGFAGKIGFISPMTHQFCSDCNRIRLTSDGKIRLCLGNNEEVDIREALQLKAKNMGVIMKQIIFNKPMGHHFGEKFSSSRKMQMIGG
ncbi:GTP 3',8-cyclase MoaA [Acetobacterium paludosum]|uniref:GTP 3',8-cyclase n=1 Tax=Acetobacterium paludosum TaxID=52693 RepID=A0A923I300_9FIRM|nr:GTP 3',8-cyclase MoaA [Acetobacterium paludosum]MBC3889033.1 GTP 3',8-cyclase MoaA [Acetobacterium paludosum]